MKPRAVGSKHLPAVADPRLTHQNSRLQTTTPVVVPEHILYIFGPSKTPIYFFTTFLGLTSHA
jgi:hypothetical protein